ncbi:MAG: hypothetical protein ACOZNI_36650 [Myxococcota bacterium]
MKNALVWAGIAVGTGIVALGAMWPFVTAWQLRETPAFLASHDWVERSEAVGELVGPNRHFESDWFPKGGSRDGQARFEHKVEGDKGKLTVGVILEERDGAWVVTKAARKTPDGYVDLEIR